MKITVQAILLIFSLIHLSFAQEGLLVGDKAPEIVITDWIENVPDAQSLEGKYIIKDFWATWCGPCLKAVPHFNELKERFSDREDVIFISISDEKPLKIQPTLKRVPFKSVVVTDQSKKSMNNFKITGIPVTVMIDNKGILRWVGEPAALKEEQVEDFLAGKIGALPSKMQELKAQKAEKPALRSPWTFGGMVDKVKDKDLIYDFQIYTSERDEILQLKALPSAFMILGDNLEGIFSSLMEVSVLSLDVDEAFKGKSFDINYINQTEKEEAKAVEDIKRNILKSLGLSLQMETREIEAYRLSIKEKSKLVPSQSSQGGISDADDKLIFTRSTLQETLPALEDALGIYLDDGSQWDDPLDLIIQITSLEDMVQSFESYGIAVKKVKVKRDFFLLKK